MDKVITELENLIERKSSFSYGIKGYNLYREVKVSQGFMLLKTFKVASVRDAQICAAYISRM